MTTAKRQPVTFVTSECREQVPVYVCGECGVKYVEDELCDGQDRCWFHCPCEFCTEDRAEKREQELEERGSRW